VALHVADSRGAADEAVICPRAMSRNLCLDPLNARQAFNALQNAWCKESMHTRLDAEPAECAEHLFRCCQWNGFDGSGRNGKFSGSSSKPNDLALKNGHTGRPPQSNFSSVLSTWPNTSGPIPTSSAAVLSVGSVAVELAEKIFNTTERA